jgi:hypothetical protein
MLKIKRLKIINFKKETEGLEYICFSIHSKFETQKYVINKAMVN